MVLKPIHTPEYVAALELALHKWEPLSGQVDIRQTLAFKDGFDAAWNAAIATHPGRPEPSAPKCDGSGAVSVSVDDWSECPVCRGAGCQPESHKWDEDGERCERCGDKDWMPDSVCLGRKQQPSGEVTHGNTTMDECMASLLDRLEVAEMYADRYRYLRERPLDAVSSGGVFAGKTPDNVVLNGADLDAAIDAARAQGGES